MTQPLHNLSEDSLISGLRSSLRQPPEGVIGIGDDCAVLPDNTLLKTDCVIEGRHYLPDTAPKQVGRKALARVMSDLAAMGGHPEYFLITCGLRASTDYGYLQALYAAMDALCAEFGGYIIGGETCSVPENSPQFFSIAGYGSCAHPITRSGAQLGDGLYVTGELGNSFSSGHHLDFTPQLSEAAWLVEHARPSAMMDLSDGLAKDLPRLAQASKVGYDLTPALLPLRAGAQIENALNDGEDYELLFTLPPEIEPALSHAPFPVTRIGQICAETTTPLTGGWDHLTK